MKKILGILGLLIAVCVVTAVLSDSFLTGYNLENLVRRSALFGILSIGVAFVIITGGIDLSIGSVVCLSGCALPWLLSVQHWPLPLALLTVARALPFDRINSRIAGHQITDPAVYCDTLRAFVVPGIARGFSRRSNRRIRECL